MDLRQTEKMIWATLWGISAPEDDYVIGVRWVKKHFADKGFMKTEAERKRFDIAWIRARKKMLKLAK
jgi:hypothetical protein